MTWKNRIVGEGEEALDPGSPDLRFSLAVTAPAQRGQVAEVVGRHLVATKEPERLDMVDMEMSRVLGGGAAVLANTTVSLQCGPAGATPSIPVGSVSANATGVGAIALATDPLGKAILRTEGSARDLPGRGGWEHLDYLSAYSARHADTVTLPDLGATTACDGAEYASTHPPRSLHLKLNAALFAPKHPHGVFGPLVLRVLSAAKHILRAEPIKAPAMNADRRAAVGAPSIEHIVGALEPWFGLMVANVRSVWMEYRLTAPTQACLLYLVHLLIIGGPA